MAVPKNKTSKHRKRKRRSHMAIAAPGTSICKRCGQTMLPHAVCTNCGYYKGAEIVSKD